MSLMDMHALEQDQIAIFSAVKRFMERYQSADLEIDELDDLGFVTAQWREWLDRKRGERMAKIEQAVRFGGMAAE
jgi:hypothetical protein